MALGLEDLKKANKSSGTATGLKKQKVLRPWQSYDEQVLRTRTLRAQEAVVKAKEIVERIEHKPMPGEYYSKDVEVQLKTSVQQALPVHSEQVLSTEKEIKKYYGTGLWGLFRYVLQLK